MNRHLTTDPACVGHREPRTWFGRRRYDRNRGRSCSACMLAADRRAFYRSLGFGRGEAAALEVITRLRS